MTHASFPLVGRFPRLRIRPIATFATRTWSIGGARTNPDLHDLNDSNTMFGQLITALRRRRIRQQWQHELRALDDRQLLDIGISRDDAERTIGQFRFWI